jgi:AbrB family looped-hinge helix DNA binding protein
MKIHGIIRRVDDLGRIIIPKELREKANIPYGQKLEIVVIDGLIIMGKVSESEGEENE